MVNLTSLELSLIKVGVDKEQSIILKEDLSKNKLGSPFEKIVVLFWKWLQIKEKNQIRSRDFSQGLNLMIIFRVIN